MLRSSFCKARIASTALTVALGGICFSNSALIPSRAYAETVPPITHQGGSFADIVEKVKPAVVSVQVKSNEASNNISGGFFDAPGFDDLPDDHPLKRFFQEFGDRHQKNQKKKKRNRIRPIAQGSGFFISSDGYIVTNNHVIDDGTSFSVILDDGKELDAKLVGSDPRTDLAVLKVDSKNKFPFVTFADDSKVRVGDWVVAVGNPFGLGGTVTAGIVSARGRDIGTSTYDDFIQIDAAVNRGNSGGPTFNLEGKVVGINTAIFSPSGGNVGIAFAIPASTAQDVISQLIKKGSVERGWIGVLIQPVTQEMAESVGLKDAKGAIIVDPEDGPGSKAGLKAGDIVLSVNGVEVKDVRDFARKIANIRPNDTATLNFWRDGKMQKAVVKVQAMPDKESKVVSTASASGADPVEFEQLGLTATVAEGKAGLVITDVDSDSDAADKGIRPGDIIVAVNNKEIHKPQDLTDAVAAAKKKGRSAVLLQVQTNGQNHFVALSIN